MADVMLVLGSSLTVTPAADMPRVVGEQSKLRNIDFEIK